jgi:hypothetical protein
MWAKFTRTWALLHVRAIDQSPYAPAEQGQNGASLLQGSWDEDDVLEISQDAVDTLR